MLAVTVGSCGAAYWLGTTLGKAPEHHPAFDIINGLAIEQAALDFGEAWAQSDFTHSLIIHNRRRIPAHVSDFQVSCGCGTVEPKTLTIPSGGTAEVRAKLDLTPRTAREVGLAVRPFQVEIRPVGGAGRTTSMAGTFMVLSGTPLRSMRLP
jgi:hypothetical protein